MFFMAYFPQSTVAVDTSCWNGNARLDQGKGRRALRRRRLSCNCLLAGRFRCFHFAFIR